MPGTVWVRRIVWKFGKVLALALALMTPASALAQESTEARAYLLSINRLYEDLEYESALTQIARARNLTHTPGTQVTLALYEGVILAELNRWEESTAAFKKGLLLQPEAKLPVKVSPKVEQRFEQVRESVKQELAARQKPPPPVPPPQDRPVREPSPPVVSQAKPAPSPPPVVSQAKPEPKPEPSAGPPLPAASMTEEPPRVASRSFTRPSVLIPAIGGGVLLVLGGTTWAMSRGELSRLDNDDPALATPEDVQAAASRGRSLQTVGVGLLGAGAASLGFALGWYAFGSPASETALSVSTDGTSAFVQGRWP